MSESACVTVDSTAQDQDGIRPPMRAGEVEDGVIGGYGSGSTPLALSGRASPPPPTSPPAADRTGTALGARVVMGVDNLGAAADECGDEERKELERTKEARECWARPGCDCDDVVDNELAGGCRDGNSRRGSVVARNISLSHKKDLVDIETLVRRGMKPDKHATRLRIKLESAHRNIWPLFKEHHYVRMNDEFQSNAHVYVATLPDYGDAVVGMVSAIPRPGAGNGVGKRKHRGHWREYRLVILPDYQGCGIGCVLACWNPDCLRNGFIFAVFECRCLRCNSTGPRYRTEKDRERERDAHLHTQNSTGPPYRTHVLKHTGRWAAFTPHRSATN